MDFFSHQDRARRNTGLLVLYFVIAVVLIVLAINGVVYFFIDYFYTAQISSIPHQRQLETSVWIYITLGTLGVILFGSLFRFLSLAGGGEAVANMVSAREVDLATQDLAEKKYINVVEEMSIASGVPLPRLYVMDNEQGINAFVAGYKTTEAVMVVTRGTLDVLSRDELQGVVAHEFSHILNGDMRINVRLIAILAGILLIGKMGQYLMSGSRRSRDRDYGMVLGLALFVVGYIGLFSGRLIKAAISRQREFLADASSVQFTRNTDGIAGALYNIQQNINGTLLHNAHAEDMSHMCFGEAIKLGFRGLLATHPPLDVRINAIDPYYLKHKKELDWNQPTMAPADSEQPMAGLAAGVSTSASGVADSIGNPGPAHLDLAHELYRHIDADLLETIHLAEGAQAFLFALVISKTDQVLVDSFLQETLAISTAQLVQQQLPKVRDLDRQLRLPLIDIAIATLKRLPHAEADQFGVALERLIKIDKKLSLLEFVLLTLVRRRLDRNAARVNAVRFHSFQSLLQEIQLIFSVLAQTSEQSAEKTLDAYQRNLRSFNAQEMPLISARDISIGQINDALNRLNQLPSVMKKSLLTSCADLVIDDGLIMPMETELLRVIAEMLDCPMPPLIVQNCRRHG